MWQQSVQIRLQDRTSLILFFESPCITNSKYAHWQHQFVPKSRSTKPALTQNYIPYLKNALSRTERTQLLLGRYLRTTLNSISTPVETSRQRHFDKCTDDRSINATKQKRPRILRSSVFLLKGAVFIDQNSLSKKRHVHTCQYLKEKILSEALHGI